MDADTAGSGLGRVVEVATAADGARGYLSRVPPEALPPVRPRDLAAAWDAARERAIDEGFGEIRFFRFLRPDAPATELALADRDACCWAAAIDSHIGLGTPAGLSLCLRLLALVHLIATAAWARGWVRFRRDGAALDPALLDAASRLPLTAQGQLDPALLRRHLIRALPEPLGVSA